MFAEISDFARHAASIRRFVATPLSPEDALACMRRGLAERESMFLSTLAGAVFAIPGSPYRKLLANAGIELGDLERLVGEAGLEGTAARLHDAGVYISIDEFRGRKPVERPGLSFDVRETDFDNPLLGAGWRSSTGGSRSLGRQVLVNREHMERAAVYDTAFLVAHDALDRPRAVWRPFASRTGTNNAIRSAKRRQPLEKWFSHTALLERPLRLRETILSGYALLACRLWAVPVPLPQHVPFERADVVARWLAEKVRAGTPAFFGSTVGSATRVAIAAGDHGLDIAGTLIRAGGEPLTEGRARVITATGATAVGDYNMAELGRVGVSCADPAAVGDVHLLTDKVVVIQRPVVVSTSRETVDVLCFTSLLPSAPKLMLNVEFDDYAVVENRRCGCLFGEMGYSLHAHGIRSYEKLNSEGVTLRGEDVLRLLEQTLPSRFGGAPTDYQLVEDLGEPTPTLSIVASPRLGVLDESEVVAVVLSALAGGNSRTTEVAQIWQSAGTLRVERREPYATGTTKVLPIHVRTRGGS